ncbi:hypothetical protein K457DRAFT_12498 [Linnemannia elongata AG-77]|uniref:F-box domain-containing protein n=1 Tax=Linnemannia elongata AG-77 TaxID=1314771 RepID=A0A197KI87_9FUNG|nr:hypothetical protein K457DRAFT_12498 [Linnemannia elongata AG-77]
MPYPIRPNSLLEAPIRKLAATLEVLIACNWTGTTPTFDIEQFLGLNSPPATPSDLPPFARMTRVDLTTRMPAASVEILKAIIPRLALVHFAVVEDTYSLLPLVDPKFLSVFHVPDIRNVTFDSLWDSDTLSPAGCQIKSLRIEATNLATFAFESQFS